MQQMINRLAVHYTSNSNSQDSTQHNGTDQSLLTTHFSTSPNIVSPAAASTQNPVLSKLLMEDQDAPLDLSVKKVQPEIKEQECVLDLSIKKNRNPDSMLIRSPVNLTTPIFRRQASDSGLAKARDLHSPSTLGQFMAKLCLHHQRQIVDAFGFLQTEVKAVTSSSEVQLSSPVVSEKPTGSGYTEELLEIEGTEEILPVRRDKNGCQELPVSKNAEVPSEEQPLEADGPSIVSIKNGSSFDLCQADIEAGDDEADDNIESMSTNFEPKCPTLLIVKNNLGNLEAKKLDSIIQEVDGGTLEEGLCASETHSQTHSTDHDISLLSSCSPSHANTDSKCLPVPSSDIPVKPCSTQRTATNSSRTAKKSSRGSHSRLRIGSISKVVNDPDSKCDIVYVGKPITECTLQSQNHILPRKNARKSTRGHLSLGDCWEIKTVRTLARKSVDIGSGNYPVPMPEITTSITPKQALAKPDGLPAMTVPFTGDCMETVMNQNLSDQSVVTELPGDVVEITSEDLIVEPSQTGQNQQKVEIPSLLPDEECDSFVQDDSNVDIHDISDSSETTPNPTMADETTEKTETTEFTTKNVDDFESNVIESGLETEVQVQNAGTELLSTDSSNMDSNTSGAEGLRVESDLKEQNAAKCDFTEQTKCPGNQLITFTDDSTVSQMPCETEANVKALDSMNPDNVESMSDLSVEEITAKELEECRKVAITKKGVAKHTLPSDRCLRSGSSKGISEQTTVSNVSDQIKQSPVESDIHEKNIAESKQSLILSKLKHTAEDLPCEGGQCNLDVTDFNPEKAQQFPLVTQIECVDKVCTRQKQKLMMKETEPDKEQKVQALPNPNDELNGQRDAVNDAPENEMKTPESRESCAKNSPGKPIKVSERMPLRKRNSQIDHSVSSDSCSPTRNIPHTPERMPLRVRNSISVDQHVDGDSCKSTTASPVEKPGRMSLRNRNSGFEEQTDDKDSPNPNSLDSATRMPLRSRNSSAVSYNANEGSSDVIKGTSGTLTDQPSGENSSVASKKSANSGHMPLRSGSGLMAEQSPSCGSFSPDAGTVPESPGRMSLRRSNTLDAEKQDCSPTPPKSKKLSPRLQKTSRTSVLSIVHKAEHNNIRAAIPFNEQRKVFSIPGSYTQLNLPTTSPLIPSPSKFLEALNGEANQHLITDLNSKFDKMQKGWVQMDKEGQPAPKPKNKADRLKEIWKSKRRIRKPRSLEQHKFSPVQMLFMKSFDLPNICRWFLQSTETKSLVIVKKVNTRLPSETQLGFQTLPSLPESSDCVFPSLQAERLKKHLKKFAIASPVKSNARNKRLIAKALARGICKGKEKRESRTATRISSKPQSSPCLTQTQSVESHSKVVASSKNPTSAKNPASARILRKYSNMREKKQVQQNSLKVKRSLDDDIDNGHCMTKKVSQEKLSTRRGQKSAMVKVSRLPKKAKPPAVKKKIPKGGGRVLERNEKGGISPRRVLRRMFKSKRVSAAKTTRKEEVLVKTEKSPQTKTDSKKSPLHRGSESLSSLSHIMDIKPLLSEDQVLTRSQRKMEATLAQTGSPKTSMKRGMETSVTLAKRTRTSK